MFREAESVKNQSAENTNSTALSTAYIATYIIIILGDDCIDR